MKTNKMLQIANDLKKQNERKKHLQEIKKIVNSKTYNALIYDLSARVSCISEDLDFKEIDLNEIILFCLEQQKKISSKENYSLTAEYF
jgi:triosephosphate isomerase